MALITEDHLEQQCLEWFKELGYTHVFAPQLDSDGTSPERTDFRQVILTGRLRSALQRLNPEVPASTKTSEAMSKALRQRGFKFVGPTICYAYMQAVGMVNDHLVDCFRYTQLSSG